MSLKDQSDITAPPARQNEDGSRVSIADVIRILLGLVFLSAALYRVFHYSAAEQEISCLALPRWTPVLVIFIELALAAAFLTGRYVRHASLLAVLFLAAPICLSMLIYARELASQWHELFVFDATATDIFLHVVFLLLLIMICITETEEKESVNREE